MRSKELTEKQRKVLEFIKKFHNENETMPTIREIACGLNLSIGAIQSHLKSLVAKDYLYKRNNKSRSLILVEKTKVISREFARLIVCLLDKELTLPSMILEILENKLVAGKFDEVYLYYINRKIELNNLSKEISSKEK